MTAPDLPDNAALLLDLDGTLLDFAPTPDSVIVPPGLIAALLGLRARLGDAVAVVSGRPVAQVDALLCDAAYAVAGEHGAALRPSPGAAVLRPALPAVPADWRIRAGQAVAAHPGALLEDKAHGLVLHFRRAPQAGPDLHQAALNLLDGNHGFTLVAAHMAWEIRPAGIDKGGALAAIMARAPFAGRLPVYLGDDVTDEDAILAARARGGMGLRVAEAFGAPADVRAWLAAQAPLR